MKVHDESQVEEFLKMIKELSSTKLEIGIFSDGEGGKKHSKDSPITVLGIATVHEFGLTIKFKKKKGSITIPERSFMRAGYDAEKSNIEKQGEKLLEQVINLQLPVNIFFETMGEFIVGRIQEYLTNLDSPPLSQITIDRKGSSGVLIDTGQLRDSITHKVVRG